MDYRVEISARAEAELADVFAHIASHSPANAARWLDGLYQAAESLSRFPTRCALAPEALVIGLEVRQYMYGEYRLLFFIEETTVQILHVRHGARRFLKPKDFDPPR